MWRRLLAPVTPVLFVAGLALALLVVRAPSLSGGRAAARVDRCAPGASSVAQLHHRRPPDAGACASPRVLAWPGQPGVPYYLVRVLRGRTLVYEARPKTPRIVLPESVTLTPGTYRWSVRAGIGAPARNRLGVTIVDSTFVVAG